MNEQAFRDIVEAATRAPSIHNTQPWRFVTRPHAIELWTDPSRGLAVLDPTGRSRHISCGAALLNARLAAAEAGYATAVTLAPDPAEPTHLADLELQLAPPAEADRDLAAAIPTRHTGRAPFTNKPIAAYAVHRLHQAVEAEGAWLRLIDTTDDGIAVSVLSARADELERSDPAYVEELRRWTERGDAGDGIPVSAVPPMAPSERGSNYPLRDFVADRGAAASIPAATDDGPPPVERPVVALIGTADDDVNAWITAGQALGRLLLTATAHGVSASPLTQALEVTSTRARLVSDLGLVGHPQMLLRLGYGGGGGHTPRRRLEDVLV